MEYSELVNHIGKLVVIQRREKGKPVVKTVTLTGLKKSTVSADYDICYFKNQYAEEDVVGLCSQITAIEKELPAK